MPDRDDMPDPMDDAYLRAEAALGEEAERAARRARVLGAVASEPAIPEASVPPPARHGFRRPGGWLMAASIAGLSVWTAVRVYRPSHQPVATPASVAPSRATPVAPPIAKAVAPPPVSVRPASPPPDIAAQDITPPPLPIPPVPAPIAPPTPPPPPPAAAAVSEESAVVTAQRMAPRFAAAPQPSTSAAVAVVEGGARLRAAAAAGRPVEIDAALAQGAPIDAMDADGETALMKAIEAGHRDAAVMLRRHGASLDLKNHAGVSARDMAARADDPELDRALGLKP